jgi:hypothetical protein
MSLHSIEPACGRRMTTVRLKNEPEQQPTAWSTYW